MKAETILSIVAFLILVGAGIFYMVTNNSKNALNTQSKLDLEGSSQSSQTEDSQTTMPQDQTTQTKALAKPNMQIDTAKTYQAILKTSEGDITVELNAAQTPITVNNFVYLAKNKLYDNTIFHRIIKGFMIQGGDPAGNGTGGPGYRFDDEKFEGDYMRGTIAMANAGPNTNGSQFFIMHADYPLPKNYVIFGKVTQGMEVVDTIAEAPVKASPMGENSTPVTPVTVKTVEIIEK